MSNFEVKNLVLGTTSESILYRRTLVRSPVACVEHLSATLRSILRSPQGIEEATWRPIDDG